MALRGKFRPEATIAMGIDAFYLVLPLMLEGLKSLVYEMVRVAEMPGMKAEVLLKAVSKAKTQSPKKGRSKGYTKRGK